MGEAWRFGEVVCQPGGPVAPGLVWKEEKSRRAGCGLAAGKEQIILKCSG